MRPTACAAALPCFILCWDFRGAASVSVFHDGSLCHSLIQLAAEAANDASPRIQSNLTVAQGGRTNSAPRSLAPPNSSPSPENVTGGRVAHFPEKLVLSAFLLGSVFGMMGSGGSMIAKPLLYYVFEQRPFKLTIFEMYCILVCLGVFGAIRGVLANSVAFRHVLLFGVCTSFIGTSIGAGIARLLTSDVQMLVFGCLIMLVSWDMWPKEKKNERLGTQEQKKEVLATQGRTNEQSQLSEAPPSEERRNAAIELMPVVGVATFAGVLCGTLGVGGGFLLTPSLVKIGHDLETAVPTCLAIICINACVGAVWYAYFYNFTVSKDVDLILVGGMVSVGCLGMLCSDWLASRMPKMTRQRVYAVLLLCLGAPMVVAQVYNIRHSGS